MASNARKIKLHGTPEFIEHFLKYAPIMTAQELYDQGRELLAANNLDGCTVLQYAAQIGHPEACMIMANAILSGSGWGSPEDAVKYLTTAADNGNIEALTNLAICYQMGHGVKTNMALGYSLLLKASALGDNLATLNIAQMYFTGTFVQQDKIRGWVLTQELVAKGLPEAKDFMDKMIKSGYVGPDLN